MSSISETLDSSLSRGSNVTSCFDVPCVCDVIFKLNETKVAASMLSKLRLKLGYKLLNVSQTEARMSKERQNLGNQICQSITIASFDTKGSESVKALHDLCRQVGLCYQGKPGGLSGKIDVLSPGGL